MAKRTSGEKEETGIEIRVKFLKTRYYKENEKERIKN